VNDRNDDLSTADLAGQSAGSGTADERAVRGEPAGRTGERDDAFPGDRSADADYADDRSGVGRDRVDGMARAGFPGGTPADRAAYADDDPTMTTDGAERGGLRRRTGPAPRSPVARWPTTVGSPAAAGATGRTAATRPRRPAPPRHRRRGHRPAAGHRGHRGVPGAVDRRADRVRRRPAPLVEQPTRWSPS
jgi:hypothetical protein